MKRVYILIFMALVTLGVTSCLTGTKKAADKPVLTFVASTSGVHDNGYMQAIHSAISRWAEQHPDVKTVLIEPTKFGEGDQAYLEWVKNTSQSSSSMIVMGGSEYLDLIMNQTPDLSDNQHVLLIESKEKLAFPKGVSSFYIDRNGASFLMGCLAKNYHSPLVLAALEKEAILQSYIKAFEEGLKEAADVTPQVTYLSEGYDGFQMPEKAKEISAQYADSFIYPLNGESIKGVFEALNECSDDHKMVGVGLDMDCNHMSDRIVASMVVNFDKVFDVFLGAWVKGEDIPVYLHRGMKDGFVDIVLNDKFKTVNGVSAADYKAIKAQYMEKAIQYEEK